MKRFLLIVVFAFCSFVNADAQNPINVVITGECADFSGTYIFNGLVNGKNNYTQTLLVDGEVFIVAVGFDNTKWVLYADGDLSDNGFSNIAVPASLLPPFTGWVNTQCPDGTMVIEESLSIGEVGSQKSILSIYPNPTSNYLTFKSANTNINVTKYVVFDVIGREVQGGNIINEDKVYVGNLTNGSYILQLTDAVGQKSSHRFIKQ